MLSTRLNEGGLFTFGQGLSALNTFVLTNSPFCFSNSGLALVAAWVSGRWLEEKETVTRNALGRLEYEATR